ncbi:hypothetical protein AWB78_02103 [Caballeronia calidae]|uniref:Baseplate J-like protein n=1 Tax=Caballeronia calidae TaxID=1777139 RepID=A0A158AYB3_9BURK|nr:hypothetical protein [Caballeronia calidae]SAK62981.1 hypothetical protein AWB78_02103 [Caballeronia calidae]
MMQTPHLDDRDFDDLVREGLALLPIYAPEWTDHNPSDPGVTLIELLAYFADILLYRIGRVTPAAKLQFLRLLKGSRDYDFSRRFADAHGQPSRIVDPMDELAREIREAVSELSHLQCAVTPGDFEQHALAVIGRELPGRRACAHCIANADLSAGHMRASRTDARGHVSLLIALPEDVPPHEAARVRDAVRADLLPRCLLTTRLHVLAPPPLRARIGFALALLPGASRERVLDEIRAALRRRYALFAADDDTGINADADASRIFGQPLNLSEVAALIDDVDGVDYVEDVTVRAIGGEPDGAGAELGVQIGATSTVGIDARLGGPHDAGEERLERDSAGALSSVMLRPWEVLMLDVMPDAVRVIDRPAPLVLRGDPGEGAVSADSGADNGGDSDRD